MTSNRGGYPFIDLSLSRRLERTEATANAESVAARARLWPETGAEWIDVGGTYAMFDGSESPLTQTFGLGLFGEAGPGDLDRLEQFFRERAAPVFHEVSPLASRGLAALLGERGYRPCEFTSVMFRPTPMDVRAETPGPVRARIAAKDEEEAWGRTAAAGWSEYPEVAGFMRDIGRLSMATRHLTCFVAEVEGQSIATGVLSVHEGVALLAGASTVPGHRGRGAQLALLDARLRFAVRQGCDLAMMCAAPGSASQRNAERHGFRVAYTRVKWRL